MAYMNDPKGRLCDWGIPRTECWGVRLPAGYQGEVPPQMLLADIPEGEYIVFEHGPFDYAASGCCLDTMPGRPMYFYYDPNQYFKYIRPVLRTKG